jgi:hypothetical protein
MIECLLERGGKESWIMNKLHRGVHEGAKNSFLGFWFWKLIDFPKFIF